MFSYNYLVLFSLRYIYNFIFVQRIVNVILQNHFHGSFISLLNPLSVWSILIPT